MLPLVTVRTGLSEEAGRALRYGPSAFRNQELLLGARVYDLPTDGVCPVGSDVFVWAPDFTGTARLGTGGRPAELRGGLPRRRAAMEALGPQVAAGTKVAWRGRGAVPQGSVGCLDRGRFAAAVAALEAAGGAPAVDVRSDGVRAVFPAGTDGLAVLAAPRIAGWRCQGRPAGEYLGLVAVELSGRTALSCTFRPPGAACRARRRGGCAARLGGLGRPAGAAARRGGGRRAGGGHGEFTRTTPCRRPGADRRGVACPAWPLF